jgi:hypothetical protein
MDIVDAKWTSIVNMLKIQCHCGEVFFHRSDRVLIKCPKCNSVANCLTLKARIKREVN